LVKKIPLESERIHKDKILIKQKKNKIRMIKNQTRKKILTTKTKNCKTILSKAKGLMFTRKKTGEGLIFAFNTERRWSIHMLFVFYPIDVLWLDKNKKVVDLRQKLKPFILSAKPKKESSYIIELPAGTINKTKTKIGDKISF
jgi:uncharacterized protein